MAKKQKTTPTFGSIASDLYAKQRGAELATDPSLTIAGAVKAGLDVATNYADQAAKAKEEFLSNMPDDFEVELLPTAGKEDFVNFASDQKLAYADAAAIASKYSANPSSKQYKDAVKQMEAIKGGLKNSFDSYKDLQTKREEYINMSGNELAMTDKERIINNDIVGGEIYKKLRNTPEGLVYDYTNPETNEVEQIPYKDLFTVKAQDPQLGININKAILENPNTNGLNINITPEQALAGVRSDINIALKNPNNVRQLTFNGGFGDDPNTRYIDHYVAEQALLGTPGFEDLGVVDEDGDGKADKFKGGLIFSDNGEKFKAKIKELQNDPKFINQPDFRQGLNNFLFEIGKESFETARKNAYKNKKYNLTAEGYGIISHNQVQVLHDKLNNHEEIISAKGVKFTPVQGKPGFYRYTNKEGNTYELDRMALENNLGIGADREDFNTETTTQDDATETTTTTTADGTTTTTTASTTTTTPGEVPEQIVKDIDENQTQKVEVETPTEIKEPDYANQTKKEKPSRDEVVSLRSNLKAIINEAKNTPGFNNPKNIEELEAQIALSDKFISSIDEVYLGTGEINKDGKMRRSLLGVLTAGGQTFGKNYNSEKKRNKKLKEDLQKLKAKQQPAESQDERRDVPLVDRKKAGRIEQKRAEMDTTPREAFIDRGEDYEKEQEKLRKQREKEELANRPTKEVTSRRYNPRTNNFETYTRTVPLTDEEIAALENRQDVQLVDRKKAEQIDNNLPEQKLQKAKKVASSVSDKKLNTSIQKHIGSMEGWRSKGYIPSKKSGITIGYGIDLSQPPYNTVEGLREAGFFSEDFINLVEREGVLGKTWDQLKAEGKDVGNADSKSTAYLDQFKISDTVTTKSEVFNSLNKDLQGKMEPYKDTMGENAYVSYFSYNHHAKPMSAERMDVLAQGDLNKLNPLDRKAYVAGWIKREIDKTIEANGVITDEQYADILEQSLDVIGNFKQMSPKNAKTITDEIAKARTGKSVRG